MLMVPAYEKPTCVRNQPEVLHKELLLSKELLMFIMLKLPNFIPVC